MPFTSDKLRLQLGLEVLKDQNELNDLLNKLSEGELPVPEGHKINEAVHLFSRVDDQLIEAQMNKLKRGHALAAPAPVQNIPLKETISIDDFNKIDLRAGTILTADKVAKADKLLHLTVDLGFEQRTILSGIAQHFKPADLPGQRVVIVANLAPRKMKGIDSNGMILLSENTDGSLKFVEPHTEAENGSVVK